MEKRRVVITGLGAVTPLGHTARETWEAAKAGVCGIAPITLYDHSAQKVSLAGEVKEFDPSGVLEKKEIRRMDRFAQFAVTAAAEAMAHSGLDLEREDRARIGVALSSGIGGIGWRPAISPSASDCTACASARWRPAPAAPMRWVTLSATSGTATPR